MKKLNSLLFFIAMLIALPIAAQNRISLASSKVNKAYPEVFYSRPERVQITDSLHTSSAICSGKIMEREQNTESKVPMKVEGLSVSYKEPKGIFALGFSEDFYGYNDFSYRKGPAYTPLTWTNTSVGASEYEWEIYNYQTNQTDVFKTVDLTHSQIWSILPGPVLRGINEEGKSSVFQFGAENISDNELAPTESVAYYLGGNCELDSLNFGMTTYMYGQNGGGYVNFNELRYCKTNNENFDPVTGLERYYSDADVSGFADPQFEGFANVFTNPAAPYIISRMWCWLSYNAIKSTEIEMRLYRIEEEGMISNEVIATGKATLEPSYGQLERMVAFDLFSYDENGLRIEDPIVVDCSFMAVMTINRDDFEEVTPACGGGATAPLDVVPDFPFNAYIVISDGNQLYFRSQHYYYYSDDEHKEYRYATDFMWMVDAIFPWAVAVDGRDETEVPAKGGFASFNISSYYPIEFRLPDGCDWIDIDKATFEINEEMGYEVFRVPVAPLPEGVLRRSTQLIGKGPGTDLILTVNQGEAGDDDEFKYNNVWYSIIDVDDKTCETKYSGNKVSGDLIIPAEVSDGESFYTVTKIGENSFSGSYGLRSVTIPETVTHIGTGAFADCERLTSLVWLGHTRLDYKVVEEIGNPNLLVYVNAAEYAPAGMESNVVVDGVCPQLDLTPGYAFTPLKEFTALRSRMVKEFTQKTYPGICAGWETIVLPFDAAKVYAENIDSEIVPFSTVTDRYSQRPYWLYEADAAGDWKEAVAIHAGIPYIISTPNNSSYPVYYNVNGPVVFSNDAPQRITPATTAPYAVTWISGSEFRSLWLPLEETEKPEAMGLNSGIDYLRGDDGLLLPPGSAFHADVVPSPMEAYVTRAGAERARKVMGDLTAVLPVVSDEDLDIRVGSGCIHLLSLTDRTLTLFTPDGAAVRTVSLKAGDTTTIEALTPGIYILSGRKVTVR